MHVWELKGPSDGWGEQLERYSNEQPVFAVLSGIGRQEWAPIHDFCERAGVPCLFPNADPPVIEEGLYSFYLSRGLSGEAEALARHIRDRTPSEGSPDVFQVYRDAGRSLRAAVAFRRALGASGIGLQELKLGSEGAPPAIRHRLVQAEKPTIFVLWLERADIHDLPLPKGVGHSVHEIYVSYRLMEGLPPPLPERVASEVGLTYPFTLPGLEVPRIYRLRAWLRSRGVERRHERIQLNTYFALSVADHALVHLVDHFSREYFMESVEHETENALNPGVYPRLSLGPGQRFASKGSYVVRLAADGGIAEVSDWIVP